MEIQTFEMIMEFLKRFLSYFPHSRLSPLLQEMKMFWNLNFFQFMLDWPWHGDNYVCSIAWRCRLCEKLLIYYYNFDPNIRMKWYNDTMELHKRTKLAKFRKILYLINFEEYSVDIIVIFVWNKENIIISLILICNGLTLNQS